LMRLTRDPASEILSESFQPTEHIGFTFPIGGGSALVRGSTATIAGTGRDNVTVSLYRGTDRIRADAQVVYLNDQPVLTGMFGRITLSHDLTQWGGDPDLEGTVYSVGDSP